MEDELDYGIYKEHEREFEEVSSDLSLDELETMDTELLESFGY